jgi:hypothetical protein
MILAAVKVSYVSKTSLGEGKRTAQALQALVQSLDVTRVDIRDISHKVGNVTTRVRHLLSDVVVTEDGVNLTKDTGSVGVDEDDTDVVLLSGGEGTKGDLGHVDSTKSVTLVDVTDEVVSDLNTDGTLGLLGGSSNVGREDQVLEGTDVVSPGVELGVEVVSVGSGLRGKDVDGSTGELSRAHSVAVGVSAGN